MSVTVYKGNKFRALAGNKVYYNSEWIELSGEDKIQINGVWHSLIDEYFIDVENPFTIYRTGEQEETTITLQKNGSPVVSGLYYRYGNSGNWIPLADSSGTLSTLTLNSTNGYEVQFYNTNDTFSTYDLNYLQFSFSGGNVGCKGNIQSLMNFSNECKPYCYYGMFENCTSLTEAPELLATTLAAHCYSCMFSGCTSLTKAPELLATTLADYCYNSMFWGCTSLTEAPELSATTLVEGCYRAMFLNCTRLTKAPELPATNLSTDCYYRMFYGCKRLTKAPELPATTLADSCYQEMFYECTSLNYIKVGFTSWHSNATYLWVSFVSSSGSFEAPSSLPVEYGSNRIPNGWSVVNK